MHPGCAYVSAVIDCATEISRKRKIKPKEVEEIVVYVHFMTLLMDDLARLFANPEWVKRFRSSVALNFYTPFNVAVALLRGSVSPQDLTVERALDSDVWMLMEKVRVELMPGLLLSTLKMPFGARVKVKLRNGEVLSAECEVPVGAAGNPYPAEERFSREASGVLGNERVREIIRTIENLEKVRTVSEVVDLLCKC